MAKLNKDQARIMRKERRRGQLHWTIRGLELYSVDLERDDQGQECDLVVKRMIEELRKLASLEDGLE